MKLTETIIEYHRRTHQSIQKLFNQCRLLNPERLNRELPGFGSPSVRLQIHHILIPEQYWFGVLRGRINVKTDDSEFPDVDSLGKFRFDIYSESRAYLESVDDNNLLTPRRMITWGDEKQLLQPSYIIMRVRTHAYHHLGQVAAMCRLLGSPVEPGLNFPMELESNG